MGSRPSRTSHYIPNPCVLSSLTEVSLFRLRGSILSEPSLEGSSGAGVIQLDRVNPSFPMDRRVLGEAAPKSRHGRAREMFERPCHAVM